MSHIPRVRFRGPVVDAMMKSLVLACGLFVLAGSASADGRHNKHLRFDVAMDGGTFFFEGGTNENGFPLNGTPFIVRGYIYPAGTFDAHGADSGVNLDGTPQFPELVLGIWYCRGWHLQDGDAQTGPVVATTQIFDLKPAEPGRHTLVTDGIELADFGVWFRRAITGGSGKYRNARGEHRQVYVDFNASGGFNTSFVLKVRR